MEHILGTRTSNIGRKTSNPYNSILIFAANLCAVIITVKKIS
jgi:hypothetical protein